LEFKQREIKGVVEIVLDPKEDARGSLTRTYCEKEFARAGLPIHWVQSNHTVTQKKGAIRGMHWQEQPYGEHKIVRCLKGKIFDVIVDIRPESKTFGQWISVELSEELPTQLFLSAGLAHGFQCLTDDSHLFYQMSEYYFPEKARGVRWDDPDIAIGWPLACEELSSRDKSLPLLSEIL